MKKIIFYLRYLAVSVALVGGQLVISNSLPAPFNLFNVVVTGFIGLMLLTNRSVIIWLTVPVAFLMELFSAAPYGAISVSLFFSVAMLHWCLTRWFTNFSVIMVLATGLLGIVCYRGLWFGAAWFIQWLQQGQTGLLITPTTLLTIGVEALVSTLIFTSGYGLAALFIKRLNPRYLVSTPQPFYVSR